jgi:hypothetical protein
MLESGSSGSVRGASSNGRPYREPAPEAEVPRAPMPDCRRRKGVGPHFIHDLVKRVDPESSFRATPETSRLRISLRR